MITSALGPDDLGHGRPAVLEAVQKAALGRLPVLAHPPSARSGWPKNPEPGPFDGDDPPRDSGTEAGMSAIRLARGATGRSKVHQNLRLLPRPCRLVAGQGWLGPGRIWQRHQRRCAARSGAAHHRARIQQHPQLEEAFALHGKELACVMIRTIAEQHDLVRASVPFMKRCREHNAPNTVRCWCWMK